MAVKGVFASNQNIVGTRKGDFASALLQTTPDGSAPFLALSSGMPSRDAMDTIVTWFEENHLTGQINITNNAGTGTSMVVDDATQVVTGQVYLVHLTGEYIYVESVSGSTLTVTRGLGPVAATAVDGSGTPRPMQRVGTAYEEGSSKPTAFANLGFPRMNYMQIFRNAWDVTGTARALEFYTGDIVAKNKADAALFHAEDIERSAIWGVKAIGQQNGKPFRMMDGVRAQLTSNLATQVTNTKWADLRNFFQNVFSVNIKGQPNERIAFCGNSVLAVLDQIALLDGTVNLSPGQTEFGMKITRLRTPFGDINLLRHPLMVENPVWTEDMVVLHPAAVEFRYLRRTAEDNYDKSGSRAGADADFGVVTTEVSVTYKAEKTGGYYTGIDTAAAT
jgi:hypothetical protein